MVAVRAAAETRFVGGTPRERTTLPVDPRSPLWYRAVPTAATLVVAAASFALSWVALRDTSVRVGAVAPSMGWLVPLVVDGGIIAGSAVLWSEARLATVAGAGGGPAGGRRAVRRLAGMMVAALAAVSVLINVSHASPGALSRLIAGMPPVVLLACVELVALQWRTPLRTPRGTGTRAVRASGTTPRTGAEPGGRPAGVRTGPVRGPLPARRPGAGPGRPGPATRAHSGTGPEDQRASDGTAPSDQGRPGRPGRPPAVLPPDWAGG